MQELIEMKRRGKEGLYEKRMIKIKIRSLTDGS